MSQRENWKVCNSEVFWREVAPCSHVVQLYKDDHELLNLLESYVTGGITSDDSVIIIATKEHLRALEQRMRGFGLNVEKLCASNQYIPLDAEETLSKFMVDDCPDYSLFVHTITTIFDRVRDSKHRVRAYGEMVAILWEQGNSAGTIMLEHLWNAYFEKQTFSLFCAYPKNKFPEDATNALSTICKTHSSIITPAGQSMTELSYLDVN